MVVKDEGREVVVEQIFGGNWDVTLIWGVLSQSKHDVYDTSTLKGIRYNLLCS